MTETVIDPQVVERLINCHKKATQALMEFSRAAGEIKFNFEVFGKAFGKHVKKERYLRRYRRRGERMRRGK